MESYNIGHMLEYLPFSFIKGSKLLARERIEHITIFWSLMVCVFNQFPSPVDGHRSQELDSLLRIPSPQQKKNSDSPNLPFLSL